MSRTYFIADVHLRMGDRIQERLFALFVQLVLQQQGSLYIVGDLFDFWANNRTVYRSTSWVFEKLKELRSAGGEVGILTGNRDFLLSRRLVERHGIAYLGEEASITIEEKRFFLAHGHTLCLADTKFLSYRARVWPLFRALDRVLPGWIENYAASRCMQQSKKVIEAQDPSRFAFTRPAIEKLFADGMDYVICGHTHKTESFCKDGHCFHVLPAWDDGTAHCLVFEEGTLSMQDLKP